MKYPQIIKIIFGIATCIIMTSLSLSVEASDEKYHCQEINGNYGVYSRVPRGDIRLMEFSRDIHPDWSIESRCQEVAKRFQQYYDNEILSLIGSGHMNNQPVLCAVLEAGEACGSDNILVTLPPNTEPTDAARQLMDTRSLARGRVISVNGNKGKLEIFVNNNTYYDINVLEQLILEDEGNDRLIEK